MGIDDTIEIEVTIQVIKGIGNEVKTWTKQFSVRDAIHMSLADEVPTIELDKQGTKKKDFIKGTWKSMQATMRGMKTTKIDTKMMTDMMTEMTRIRMRMRTRMKTRKTETMTETMMTEMTIEMTIEARLR